MNTGQSKTAKEALEDLTKKIVDKASAKKRFILIDGVVSEFLEDVLEKIPTEYKIVTSYTQTQAIPISNVVGGNGRPQMQMVTFVYVLFEFSP